ncbi:MAG: M48 family metalloprotease [Rhodospirillaceae bacterium]
MPRIHVLVLTALLAACAQVGQQPSNVPAQRASPARASAMTVPPGLIADQIRLFQVSYPLLRAAHEWCRDGAVYGMGLYALNRYTMGAYANVAWQYGIGDQMRVLAATRDGPAYRAGLTAGDVILSVNGDPAPTTAASTRAFALKMAQIARVGTPVTLAVQRGDETVTATVQPEKLCGYQVQVTEVPQVNARTDGRRTIFITRGMLDFAQSDAELALVVGHEIAHNAMGHLNARTQLMRSLAAAGRPPDTETANGMTPAFSQALEMEADHMGLYIVARAGMPVNDAPRFIERLATTAGGNVQARTHPASTARIAAINRTVSEIEKKRLAGLPLTP